MTDLTCPYCGKPAKCVDSIVIYKKRSYGFAWVCGDYPKCDAYVGCHPKSKNPLGRLANFELRRRKNAAHAAFDPIWKKGKMNRHQAYGWLAEKLGIKREDCHIGMFNVDMCDSVVKVCENALETLGVGSLIDTEDFNPNDYANLCTTS